MSYRNLLYYNVLYEANGSSRRPGDQNRRLLQDSVVAVHSDARAVLQRVDRPADSGDSAQAVMHLSSERLLLPASPPPSVAVHFGTSMGTIARGGVMRKPQRYRDGVPCDRIAACRLLCSKPDRP